MANVNLIGTPPLVINSDVNAKEITISVSEATTTAKGVVQLATANEVTSGTVNNKAVTGSVLKEYVDSVKGSITGGMGRIRKCYKGTSTPYSDTFIAPDDGYYTFICTGAGAAGVYNVPAVTTQNLGGGGGGCISGTVFLSKDDAVDIAIDATSWNGGDTTLTYKTSLLRAFGGKMAVSNNIGGVGGSFESFGSHFENVVGANGRNGDKLDGPNNISYHMNGGQSGDPEIVVGAYGYGGVSLGAGQGYSYGGPGSVLVIY